jgi:hypothetical protein
MDIIYQSKSYPPALVTGRYVLVEGTKRDGYRFRVFEAATGTGCFAGKPGHGPTLREYIAITADVPKAIRDKAIASKAMEQWPMGAA